MNFNPFSSLSNFFNMLGFFVRKKQKFNSSPSKIFQKKIKFSIPSPQNSWLHHWFVEYDRDGGRLVHYIHLEFLSWIQVSRWHTSLAIDLISTSSTCTSFPHWIYSKKNWSQIKSFYSSCNGTSVIFNNLFSLVAIFIYYIYWYSSKFDGSFFFFT